MLEVRAFLVIGMMMPVGRSWPFPVVSFGDRRLIDYHAGIRGLVVKFVVGGYSNRRGRFYGLYRLVLVVVGEMVFLAGEQLRWMHILM
jgi:hypothetical protein